MFNQRKSKLVRQISKYKSQRTFDHRFASFDYCYNYFRSTKNLTKDLEKSCTVLGFYLASWGMYRGSSFLLNKSVSHLKLVVEYIDSLPKSYWDIDVDNYSDSNIENILSVYNNIKNKLITGGNADLTLVSKILLGVFGFVPAFDNFFCTTFRKHFKNECGFRKFNKTALQCISTFYIANKAIINRFTRQTFTLDFKSGKNTQIPYPKAKIIDMYGFMAGQKNVRTTPGLRNRG